MPVHVMRAAAICCVLAAPVAAQDGFDVIVQDGNPLDQLLVFNRHCTLVNVGIALDFTTSAGDVVIDTAYGGRGARDPADATLKVGNGALLPVADGDQALRVDLTLFPVMSEVRVTMDLDDQISGFEDARVVAEGAELAGTTVAIMIEGEVIKAALDETGRATVVIPPEVTTCPMS